MTARFVLPIPTLPVFGNYDYLQLDLTQVQQWLDLGPYYSSIRSRDLCLAFRHVTGRTLYPLSSAIQAPILEPGEDALIFFVPPSETIHSIRDMTFEYMVQHHQFGLLCRVDVVAEVPQETDELASVSVVEHSVVGQEA